MKSKRLLALLISASFVIGMTPAMVFAEGTEGEPSSTEVTESAEPEEREPAREAEPKTDEPEEKAPAEPEEEAKENEASQPSQDDTNEPLDKAAKKPAVIASGSCGSGVTWKLDAAGTLTISKTGKGTGEMDTWKKDEAPWAGKREDIKKIVISKGVTTIGANAFQACANLKSVSIPATVKSIGGMAFFKCSGLSKISIPTSVKSIGMSAFALCSSFTSVTIPSSVTSLGAMAFQQCNGLKSAVVPGSISVLELQTFSMCEALETVTIGYGVKTIEEGAFYGCTCLKKVTLPYGLTAFGEGAFQYCSALTNITIPSSVTHMDIQTFQHCTSLTDVSITEELYATCTSSVFDGCTSLSLTDGIHFLQNNPMTVKGKKAKVKYSKLRKKTRTVAASKVLKFSSGTGPYLYEKISGKKKITINKTTGKVTVKKKLKRGTYKIKVRVMSAGNAKYKASDWKTVTFKIKVK